LEAAVLEGLRHLVATNRPLPEILRDILDITVVTVIVYRALLVLKGTRAMQMGLGLMVFGLLYLVAKHAELTSLLSLLSWVASSAILIVVVVFQNDIRRALIRVGSKAWLGRGRDAQERVVDEVVAAATVLARHRMGALMCLERDANVLEFVQSDGIVLDATVTRELLVSLFIPEAENKTHDGAVLIRDLKIARAGVFFPLPEATKVADPSLGSRHRAAIGITEETDAVVVVVSEERGTITLCVANEIVQNIDAANLKSTLLGLFGTSEKQRGERARRRRRAEAAGEGTGAAAATARRSEQPAATSAPPPVKPTGQTAPAPAVKPAGQSGPYPAVVPAKGASSASGRFQPLRRSEEPVDDIDRSQTPPPVRVSMPMPSPKDRLAEAEPAARPEPHEGPHAARAPLTKPMTPTELPGASAHGGEDS
jgi:uncharacterized protein (TIGR00159 family)